MRAFVVTLSLLVMACGGNTSTDAPAIPVAGVEIGGMCGGMQGLMCTDENTFCDYAPEAQCGAADQSGTCREIPQICTMDYNPVCGCDGQTYGNACGAASAGVSVVYEGECRAE